MRKYDFQNDLQNEAARKNYEAAMRGETRKGVEYFEKPYLWDEERPCDIKDTPTFNIMPIPTPSTGGFSEYSPLKKGLIIAAVLLMIVLVVVCAVTYFIDGGGEFVAFGSSIW